MITLAMASEIGASRAIVWHALTDPAQQARWRPGAIEWLAPGDASGDDGVSRFRVRLRGVPVVLEQRNREFRRGERIVSDLRLGLFRYTETFSLSPLARDQVRLSLRVVTGNKMPLVGTSLDRFDVRQFATDLAGITLQAVRDWAEREAAGPARAAQTASVGSSVEQPPAEQSDAEEPGVTAASAAPPGSKKRDAKDHAKSPGPNARGRAPLSS